MARELGILRLRGPSCVVSSCVIGGRETPLCGSGYGRMADGIGGSQRFTAPLALLVGAASHPGAGVILANATAPAADWGCRNCPRGQANPPPPAEMARELADPPASRAVVRCVILCHRRSGDAAVRQWLRTYGGRNRGEPAVHRTAGFAGRGSQSPWGGCDSGKRPRHPRRTGAAGIVRAGRLIPRISHGPQDRR